MKFKLEITLGNDAMQDPADVADALENAASTLRDEGFRTAPEPPIVIMDNNGNRVGQWRVTR